MCVMHLDPTTIAFGTALVSLATALTSLVRTILEKKSKSGTANVPRRIPSLKKSSLDPRIMNPSLNILPKKPGLLKNSQISEFSDSRTFPLFKKPSFAQRLKQVLFRKKPWKQSQHAACEHLPSLGTSPSNLLILCAAHHGSLRKKLFRYT
jgi:hypothetical protein